MSKQESFFHTVSHAFRRIIELPHYPRFISAVIKNRYVSALGHTLLWATLGTFVYSNVGVTHPISLTQAFSSVTRLLHIPPPQNTAVLGLTDTVKVETNALGAIRNQYAYWQTVIQDHPDYRDGFYMAALLSYQLGNTTDARTYLDKVKNIDPNYPEVTKLEELLENN